VLASQTAVAAQSSSSEKIWEGRYRRLQGNSEAAGSDQTWVFLRKADGGYVLESRFVIANPAAALLVGLASAGASVDSKLRGELEREVSQTELMVSLDAQFVVQTVVISGEKLVNKKKVVVANCNRTAKEIQCRGLNGSGKIKAAPESQLFLSFPFPVLFAPLVVQAERSSDRTAVFKAGFIEVVDNRPEVREADVRIQFERDEAITIGDRSFTAGRYRVIAEGKGEVLLDAAIWSAKNGLVLAVEDEKHFPGQRIAMVEFKRHAQFP
jgi:hypothetical protein